MPDINGTSHAQDIENARDSGDGSFVTAARAIKQELTDAQASDTDQQTYFQELNNKLHTDHFLPDFEVIDGVTDRGELAVRDNLPDANLGYNTATLSQLEDFRVGGIRRGARRAGIESPIISTFEDINGKVYIVHADQTIQNISDDHWAFSKTDTTQIFSEGSDSDAGLWTNNPDETRSVKGNNYQIQFRGTAINSISSNTGGLINKIGKSEGDNKTSAREFEYDEKNNLNKFTYTNAEGVAHVYEKVSGNDDDWKLTIGDWTSTWHGTMKLDSKTGNFTVAEKGKPVTIEKLDGSKLELDDAGRIQFITRSDRTTVTAKYEGTTRNVSELGYGLGSENSSYMYRKADGQWIKLNATDARSLEEAPDWRRLAIALDEEGNVHNNYADKGSGIENTDGTTLYALTDGRIQVSSVDQNTQTLISSDGVVVRHTKNSDGNWDYVQKRSDGMQLTTTWDTTQDHKLYVEMAKLNADNSIKMSVNDDLRDDHQDKAKTLRFGSNSIVWDAQGNLRERHIGDKDYTYTYDDQNKINSWTYNGTDSITYTYTKGEGDLWTMTTENNNAHGHGELHAKVELNDSGAVTITETNKQPVTEKADGAKITFDSAGRIVSVLSSDGNVQREYTYEGQSKTPKSINYFGVDDTGSAQKGVWNFNGTVWSWQQGDGTAPKITTLKSMSLDADGTMRLYDDKTKTTTVETTDRKKISQTDGKGVVVRDLVAGTVTTELNSGKSVEDVLKGITPSLALARSLSGTGPSSIAPEHSSTLGAASTSTSGDGNTRATPVPNVKTGDSRTDGLARQSNGGTSGDSCKVYDPNVKAADWWKQKHDKAKADVLKAIKDEHKTELKGAVGMTVWDLAAANLMAKTVDAAQPKAADIMKEMQRLQQLNRWTDLCSVDLSKLDKSIKLAAASETSN